MYIETPPHHVKQHPFYRTVQEKQRNPPVNEHDCRALLFLTLHLLWKPQMALMGGHRAGWQHIKWLQLMEIPHVQEHISKGLFPLLFYKIGHQQKVLFYHM